MLTEIKNPILKEGARLLIVTLASLIFAINVNTFVNIGGLFPSGLSGIAILIQRCMAKYAGVKVAYSFLYLPLNIIPIYIGLKYLGKTFTIYSIYVIFCSSFLTDLLPSLSITYDTLLIAIFGGLLSGIGVVICLQAGASGGGIDFISIFFSERKGIDCWNYILIGNIVLLTIAGALFGFEKSLYSIVYSYVSTQVIQLLYRRYQKQTLFIVTEKTDEIYEKIHILTNHGVTVFKGIGGYAGEERKMIYSVVGSDEAAKVIKAVHEEDPHAFINLVKTERVGGNFYTPPKE